MAALSHMAPMIIAIDGPAASGKGTLGKRLAHHYGYRHLDTGVIYRAVAKAGLTSPTKRGRWRPPWSSIPKNSGIPS